MSRCMKHLERVARCLERLSILQKSISASDADRRPETGRTGSYPDPPRPPAPAHRHRPARPDPVSALPSPSHGQNVHESAESPLPSLRSAPVHPRSAPPHRPDRQSQLLSSPDAPQYNSSSGPFLHDQPFYLHLFLLIICETFTGCKYL